MAKNRISNRDRILSGMIAVALVASWGVYEPGTQAQTVTAPALDPTLGQVAGPSETIGSKGELTLPPSLFGRNPPSFTKLFQAGQLNNSLAECTNVGGALQTLTQGQYQTGIGGMEGCGSEEEVSTSLEPGPDLVKACVDFGVEKIDGRRRDIQAALKVMLCKQTRYNVIQGDIACLKSKFNLLKNQVSVMQADYQRNIQRMTTDVIALQALKEDRKSQETFVNDRFQEVSKSEQETEAMISSISGDIMQVDNTLRENQIFADSIEADVKSEKMVRTTSCFTAEPTTNQCIDEKTRARVPCRCEKNGSPVSAYQYIQCRMAQIADTGSGGQRETNSFSQGEGSKNITGLQSIMSQIFYQGPNADGSIPPAEKARRVLTPDDVERLYGSLLRGYQGTARNPLNVHDFLMGVYRSCYGKAVQTVDISRNTPGSPIYLRQEELKRKRNEMQAALVTKLQSYDKLYTANTRAMSRQAVGKIWDLSACKNRQQPEVQAACIKQIQERFQSQLNGTDPSMTFVMTVPGYRDPRSAFNFRCAGLRACSQALTNTREKLAQEQTKIEQFTTQYVTQANQSVDNFNLQTGRVFGSQAQQMTNEFQQLQKKLAQLGFTQPLSVPEVDGEPADNSGPGGLYKMPNDVFKYVAGKMQPKMLNFGDPSFTQIGSQIAEKGARFSTEVTKAKGYLAKLEDITTQCKEGAVAGVLKPLDQQVQNFERNCMNKYTSLCDNKQFDQNKLAGLVDNIREVASPYNTGELGSITGVLDGYGTACNQMMEAKTKEKRQLEGRKVDLDKQVLDLQNRIKAKEGELKPAKQNVATINAQIAELTRTGKGNEANGLTAQLTTAASAASALESAIDSLTTQLRGIEQDQRKTGYDLEDFNKIGEAPPESCNSITPRTEGAYETLMKKMKGFNGARGAN